MASKSAGPKTVAVAFLAFVGLGLSSGLLGVAWPFIQEDFDLVLDAVTALLLVQTVAYTVASFFIGRIMARFGSGSSLVGGMLIMSLCYFGISLSSAWIMVIAFGLIAGFGSGIIDAGLNMYVTAYHSVRDMNWLHASFGVGITLGPLIMTYCVVNLNWHAGYAITGGLLVIILTLMIMTRHLWRSEGFQSAENAPVRRASFSESLRMPFSMFTFLAYVGMEIGIGQWAYTLFTQSRGIAPEVAGPWVSIYWGVFTGGRIFFGFIANRFEPARLLRVCLLAVIVGVFLFAWNPLPIIGSIGLIITGFAEAPVFPTLMTSTPQRVGIEHAENGVSLQMTFVGIGSAILPGLIGTIGKNLGLETMALTFVGMAVGAFIFYELSRLGQAAWVVRTSASD